MQHGGHCKQTHDPRVFTRVHAVPPPDAPTPDTPAPAPTAPPAAPPAPPSPDAPPDYPPPPDAPPPPPWSPGSSGADTVPPIIEVMGSALSVVSVYREYYDEGADAVDDVDGPVYVETLGLPIDTFYVSGGRAWAAGGRGVALHAHSRAGCKRHGLVPPAFLWEYLGTPMDQFGS